MRLRRGSEALEFCPQGGNGFDRGIIGIGSILGHAVEAPSRWEAFAGGGTCSRGSQQAGIHRIQSSPALMSPFL